MSIWNRILTVFVFLASVGMAYLAARALKTEQVWSQAAQRFEKQIAAAERESHDAVEGSEGHLGIRRAQQELFAVLLNRGRVWRNVAAKVGANGQVTVELDQGLPHGISDKAVLFAFDAADVDKGGAYLGEFKVVAVAEKQLGLQTVRTLGDRESKRLAAARDKKWNLYEVLPSDGHEVFAGLKDDQIRTMVPEAVLTEYVRDGKKADPSDPDARKDKSGNYSRMLRDYGVLLADYHRQLDETAGQIQVSQEHLQTLAQAQDGLTKQIEFTNQSIEALKKDLASANYQRDAAIAHVKTIEQSLTDLKAAVNKMLVDNLAMARQISDLQHKASRKIDLTTGVMAQAGAR